jgi:hypothetical protein
VKLKYSVRKNAYPKKMTMKKMNGASIMYGEAFSQPADERLDLMISPPDAVVRFDARMGGTRKEERNGWGRGES